jgi:hypothetical protein
MKAELELFQTFCGYYTLESSQTFLLSVDFDVNRNTSTSVFSILSKRYGITKFIGEFNFNTIIYTQTAVETNGKIFNHQESGFDFDIDSDANTLYVQYLNWQQELRLDKKKLVILKQSEDKNRFIQHSFNQIPYNEFFSIQSELLLG